MEYLSDEYGISIGRACKVVDLSRSMFYYKSKKDDGELICKLEELALNHPTRGFDDYYGRMEILCRFLKYSLN